MYNARRWPRIAAALFLTACLGSQWNGALAAAPADSVNLCYDLEVTSDWSTGEGNTVIAPAGETVLFAADWHRGSAGNDEWIHASQIAYEWSSSNPNVVSGTREVPSWYDPKPSWDPEMLVPGSYAQASTSFDNLGTSTVTCSAKALSPYTITGRSQSSVEVHVVGLNAAPVPEFVRLGQSVMLDAYWTPDISLTKQDAQRFFTDQKCDMNLWGGFADEWTTVKFVSPLGEQITSQNELQEIVGGIERVDSTFGCLAKVTPLRPGTYTFRCTPSVGSASAELVVNIMPGASGSAIGSSAPAGKEVLVSPLAENDVLRQRFSVTKVPVYDDNGIETKTAVYWSLETGAPVFDIGIDGLRAADNGNGVFIRGTGGALYEGESYTLKITHELLDYASSVIRAWVVPERAGVSEEAIVAYGKQHPDCVRAWTLQPVTGPVIMTLSGSGLKVGVDGGKTIISGLSAAAGKGMLPVEAMREFVWNAGSDTRITDADGMQLAPDRNVGTGCILSILFPGTTVHGTYGVFVVKGDVTGSGTVTLTDIVRMARALNDPSVLTGVYLQAGDFTGSGSIDITDIVTEARLMREQR